MEEIKEIAELLSNRTIHRSKYVKAARLITLTKIDQRTWALKRPTTDHTVFAGTKANCCLVGAAFIYYNLHELDITNLFIGNYTILLYFAIEVIKNIVEGNETKSIDNYMNNTRRPNLNEQEVDVVMSGFKMALSLLIPDNVDTDINEIITNITRGYNRHDYKP